MERLGRRWLGVQALALLFLLPGGLPAQETTPPPKPIEVPEDPGSRPLAEMSLEELSQLPVTVASKSAQPLHKSSGIVTLITREEIQNSGARDLIDVLRMVPGFEFGLDVRGVTSIGIRGNWAHEGKVLILWDGQSLNESLYSTIQLGNHYPVDLIERIEIVRGPGSAVYGGMAELGVINIVSRASREAKTALATASFGWMAHAPGHQNVSMAINDRFGSRSLDVSLFAGSANRSDRTMTDFHPGNPFHSFSMANQETMDSFFMNVGFRQGGFASRLIVDKYRMTDRTMYGVNLGSAPRIDFLTTVADLSYTLQLSPRLRLTPRLNYTRNTPWRCLDQSYRPPVYLDKWAERYLSSLTLDYRASPRTSLLSGLEFTKDTGHAGEKTFFLQDPTLKRLSYTNFAVYLQGLHENSLADLTLGARFERNSKAGNSFVPRVVLTKDLGVLHLKALYSFAFRSPGIENISRYSSTPITPEKTTVAEVEAAIRLTQQMSLTVNLFHIRIRDPIVFFFDPILQRPAYHNASRTGTRGLETEFRLKSGIVYTTLAYSYYQAHGNQVSDYVVTANDLILLGFPQHKLTGQTTVQLPWRASANLTATYLSKRYAMNSVQGIQYTEDPLLLLNVFLNFRQVISSRLSFGAGVYNLLGAKYSFIQPYRSDNAPLPGPSREFILKMTYQYGF